MLADIAAGTLGMPESNEILHGPVQTGGYVVGLPRIPLEPELQKFTHYECGGRSR